MSLVISNPTTIDHSAQAIGGSILKGPTEASEAVKPPGSLVSSPPSLTMADTPRRF